MAALAPSELQVLQGVSYVNLNYIMSQFFHFARMEQKRLVANNLKYLGNVES